jgi:hypothetical protein
VQADPDEAAIGAINLMRLIEIDVCDPTSGLAAQLITMPRLALPASISNRGHFDDSYAPLILISL